jgi:hypothetical protein
MSGRLKDRRSAASGKRRPPLTIQQILAWADAHFQAHGRWPSGCSGPVAGALGEDWRGIDALLRHAHRGLSGGSSLSSLLDEHRPGRRKALTVDTILAWAGAHHAATGEWPTKHAGPVLEEAAGEAWHGVNLALERGLADAHSAATGTRPTIMSGPVPGAPGEKWRSNDDALKVGTRGLAGGSGLGRLLEVHRHWGRRSAARETILAGCAPRQARAKDASLTTRSRPTADATPPARDRRRRCGAGRRTRHRGKCGDSARRLEARDDRGSSPVRIGGLQSRRGASNGRRAGARSAPSHGALEP